MRIKHKYGCMMADGGKVKKPMKKPEKAKNKPKQITTPGKPGDSGPGGAHPGRNRKKMADGGKVKKIDKKRKPKPGMLGTGMAAKAGSALKGRAAQLAKAEKDAGL